MQHWFSIRKSINVIHYIIRLKRKSHIITSVPKNVAKFKLMRKRKKKTLRKTGIEGNLLNLIKNSYRTSRGNIILDETLTAFPLRQETKQGYSFSPFLFNKYWKFQPVLQARMGNKRHIDWKHRKLSFLADGMIVYIENPKESTKQTKTSQNY